MNKNRLLKCLLILPILLIGCRDQRILEETGFIQSISYDLAEDGKIKNAISIPLANPVIKANRGFFSTVAESSKEARTIFARQTNLILVSGQARLTLFGLSLAKTGIWSYMDTFMRDPTIAEKLKIIIVNGDAESLHKKNYPEFPQTSKYIDRLIQKEVNNQTISDATLYSFTRDYYDDGVDPVAPIIKDTGKSIILDGIALFKDDIYVGKINPDDLMTYAFLHGKLDNGEMSMDLSEQTKDSKALMLSSLKSSRKISIKHEKNGNINVEVRAKVTASVIEYIGELKLSNDSDKKKLEQEISMITTQQANRIVKLLQEKNADSLGIGTHVRNSMTHKAWKSLGWPELYPQINVQCIVNIKITDHGFRY
ncbi:hypothetical protein BK133_14910 [Paenibacillus sp. FSL H8-0548]|uniref:Ger(x)C family spore germination protein n=1 Tax=Paenibacillus sp. FSL H8-0548 TaxID=1920422 RepID=UPI00096BF6D3|nr:Ger(x)C family spore germination protein [Paenibacillus sp. FSL H8-0548]OMF32136.1 hypothetical protein BK133_14910 [Paenibacillus sp. FSL H8-0548]